MQTTWACAALKVLYFRTLPYQCHHGCLRWQMNLIRNDARVLSRLLLRLPWCRTMDIHYDVLPILRYLEAEGRRIDRIRL